LPRAVSEVAKQMGFGAAFDYAGPAAIFREHAALSAFENNGTRDFDLGGLAGLSDAGYDALAPLQWPVPVGMGYPSIVSREQPTFRFHAGSNLFKPLELLEVLSQLFFGFLSFTFRIWEHFINCLTGDNKGKTRQTYGVTDFLCTAIRPPSDEMIIWIPVAADVAHQCRERWVSSISGKDAIAKVHSRLFWPSPQVLAEKIWPSPC
jgi:hypothetical protein